MCSADRLTRWQLYKWITEELGLQFNAGNRIFSIKMVSYSDLQKWKDPLGLFLLQMLIVVGHIDKILKCDAY